MAYFFNYGILFHFFLQMFTILLILAPGKILSAEVHYHVRAVEDGKAELPCDLSVPSSRSRVSIVLWYKDGGGLPIYSLDLRGEYAINGSHLISEDILGSRARFRHDDNPAYLVLDPVRAEDAGVYRCRVDFHRAPTRNQRVRLSVIEPPKYVSIVDSSGVEVKDIIPLRQGSTLVLICQTDSGSPVPVLTWWKGPSLLVGNNDITIEGVMRSELVIPNLSRQDLHSTYTCQASNNNISAPVSRTVHLDLILRPLSVEIIKVKDPLSANHEREIRCQSFGSRPPPIISWWKGNKRLKHSKEFVSDDRNVTTSILSIKPTEEDHGKYLTCRVDNPSISASTFENSWKMDVHYAPTATLQLSSSLKQEKLKEGDDIFFECSIRANPRVYKVDWKFQGKSIRQNITAGVIISNQSLVLRQIKRSDIGGYTCIAHNSEGDGESNKVNLKMKYAPYCKPFQKSLFGIAKHESASIPCEVIAVPPVVNFKWSFNNSNEHLDVARSRVVSSGLLSTITYTPRTEFDYGFLYCRASNEVGESKEPCVYNIIAAGRPDPVFNCSIQNETESTVYVECVDGFDGGLEQHFVIKVIEAMSNQLIFNATNSVPEFRVQDLEAGKGYHISVYAVNSRGYSTGLTMVANTLRVAERRTGIPVAFTITPVLGVLIGIVVALVLVAVAIVVVMRLKGPDEDEKKEVEMDNVDRATTPLKKELDEIDTVEEKNPDIVPTEDDHLYGDVQEKSDQKLNNTSERIYENVPGFNAVHREYENLNNVRNRVNKIRQGEDVMYAELQLPNNQRQTSTVRRTTEPTVYAQIDHNRKAPPNPPVAPHIGAGYDDDEYVTMTPDTPLMNNHRESTV